MIKDIIIVLLLLFLLFGCNKVKKEEQQLAISSFDNYMAGEVNNPDGSDCTCFTPDKNGKPYF